jgi:two-component system sensor histidine kinase KdpD
MRLSLTGRSGRLLASGLASSALVVAAAATAWRLGQHLGSGAQAMVLLLAVLVAAAVFGLGPGLAAAALAAAIYGYVFLAPHFTLTITHPQDLLTFTAFFAVALATGWLAGRAQDRARRLEAQTTALAVLLDTSRALARAVAPDEAAQALADRAAQVAGGPMVVLIPSSEGLKLAGAPPEITTLGDAAMAAAAQAWTGPRDGLVEGGGWTFRALEAAQGRVGVAGFRDVAAHAELSTAAAENEALRQADRLRASLLNAVSHDFRTPLAAILGSATTLADYEGELAPAVRSDLLRSIQEDARRLNQHIGALLDMARLEGGALQPRRELTDVREVAASALRRLQPSLAGRQVKRDFARELSLAPADPVLLEQVLVNLLDNAAAHTPEGAAIEVSVHEDPKCVLLAVEDEGPGVPEGELARIFDKFHRAGGSGRSGGLGLGLSIAKGFVEAMGGRLAAASPVAGGRGARFVVTLPKAVATPRGLL